MGFVLSGVQPLKYDLPCHSPAASTKQEAKVPLTSIRASLYTQARETEDFHFFWAGSFCGLQLHARFGDKHGKSAADGEIRLTESHSRLQREKSGGGSTNLDAAGGSAIPSPLCDH